MNKSSRCRFCGSSDGDHYAGCGFNYEDGRVQNFREAAILAGYDGFELDTLDDAFHNPGQKHLCITTNRTERTSLVFVRNPMTKTSYTYGSLN